jgi:hypothetical protein
MSVIVKTLSLSALDPVRLSYSFNSKQENLQSNFKVFNNDFSYVKHSALSGYKDAAFSKGNLLALTDVISFDNVLEKQGKTGTDFIGNEINNTNFKLKSKDGLIVKKNKNNLYAGGAGEEATITLVVVSSNVYELRIGNNVYLQVNQEYPYDVILTEEEIDESDFYKRRFEIDFWENKMTIKCNTPEGPRYLSYGVDRVIRGNGVYLNNTVVNSYIFTPEFVSVNRSMKESLDRMKPVEVFYYNEFAGEVEHENLFIKTKQYNETNALISCSLEEILHTDTPNTNIALLKNNFTASGAYTTK